MWYELGIALVIVGSIVGGLGFNLIKRSSVKETKQPFYCRKWLVLGVFLSTVVNTGLDLVSYALVPLTAIAPLGGVSIVASTLFAVLGVSGVRESATLLKALGVLLVTSGIVLVAVFGPRPPSTVLNVQTILDNFLAPPFVVYQSVAFAVLVVVLALLSTETVPVLSIRRSAIAALAAGFMSGLCQSLIKLFASTIAELAIGESSHPWSNTVFWFAAVELAVSGVCLFVLMKIAVESTELSIGTSLYTVAVIFGTIGASMLLYGDFEVGYSQTDLVCFVLGVTLILIAIIILVEERERRPLSEMVTQVDEIIE